MDLAITIYVYLFTGLIATSATAKVVMKLLNKYEDTPYAVQIEELISLPIMGLGCICLFGYLYNYSLFPQLFWQLYAILMLSHIVFAFWLPKLTWLRKEVSPKAFLTINFVGFITGIPFYYLVTVYAFTIFPAITQT